MAIQEINWDVIEGDTWDVSITVKDSTGTLVDFSGYTFKMEVRDREGGDFLCATASLGNGITVTGTGVIKIVLTPTQTKNLNLPRSKYQIQSIDGSGKKQTLAQGWFMVKAGTIA